MYDIRGKYDGSHHTDYEIEISEKDMRDAVKDFLQRDDYYNDTTEEEIDKLIEEEFERRRKDYCSDIPEEEIDKLIKEDLERKRRSFFNWSQSER